MEKNKKDNFIWLVGLSAFLLIGMSAYYSIIGISSLFSAKKLFTGIMAGSLEFGKVVTTSYLYRKWKSISLLMRTYFVSATVILTLISSAGIYSYLTEAYHITALKNKIVDTETNQLDMVEDSLNERKVDLQYELTRISDEQVAIREAITRNDIQTQKLYTEMSIDSTKDWTGSIWNFKKQNKQYKEELTTLRNDKEAYRTKLLDIDNKLKTVWSDEHTLQSSDKIADVGPLKKLAELFNIEMDRVVKFFIFILILVFDPLGILLVVAFNKLQLEWVGEIKLPKIGNSSTKDKHIKPKKVLITDSPSVNSAQDVRTMKT